MANSVTVEQAIGRRIRSLREGRGWSLERLGLSVGLSKQGICRIERGEVGSSPSTYEQIARTLGVTLRDLIPARRRVA